MKLSLLISISLVLLVLPLAHAQTADDFFNSGAQSYISNNIPQALETVTNGLQRYPDDVKLKKLYELLKQQSQQQQQNQKNQQNQSKQQQAKNQQSQSQKQNSNSQQNQAQQPQQAQQNSQKNEAQKNPQEPQNQQQQQAQSQSGKQNDKESEEKQAQAMTPEEAKRLLDAQKGDEQVLQLKPKETPDNSKQPVKDW
jgi:hypothetical protein